MALALYLDDCAYSRLLRTLLIAAGHTVVIPADVGLSKVSDQRHFEHARQNGLILVTKNPLDFRLLAERVLAAGGSHPGIFAIYQDNDIGRDMSEQEIVGAIANAETWYGATGFVDQFLNLNTCR